MASYRLEWSEVSVTSPAPKTHNPKPTTPPPPAPSPLAPDTDFRFNDSTIQRFNDSTIQPIAPRLAEKFRFRSQVSGFASTLQRFNDPPTFCGDLFVHTGADVVAIGELP
jgi:hypothetical protein